MESSKVLKDRIYAQAEQARRFNPLTAALVCADSASALQSAKEAEDLGLLKPVLIGPDKAIKAMAERIEWTPQAAQIIDAQDEIEAAKIATQMAGAHEVQGLIKGNIHTNTLISAVLNRSANLRTESRLTHAFYMFMPNQADDMIITDAAINVAPDNKTSLAIIKNALKLAEACSFAPRVAVLSCTDEVSPSIPSSLHAKEVIETCFAQNICLPDQICGPVAFDQAVSRDAAQVKGFEHPVAGQANVLVVPNIETGNALFKGLAHFGGAVAAGIVLGAKVPIVLTSRADPAISRLASICLAQLMAGKG